MPLAKENQREETHFRLSAGCRRDAGGPGSGCPSSRLFGQNHLEEDHEAPQEQEERSQEFDGHPVEVTAPEEIQAISTPGATAQAAVLPGVLVSSAL